jgi:hypothetical protein
MEQSLLPATWQVPQEFRDRVGSTAGRQRAMLADGHLLLVLHRPPLPDEEQREARFFWRQPDGNWTSSVHGDGAGALAKHLDEFHEVVHKFDQLEEAAHSAPEYFAVINGLAPSLRAARNLHSALQEARKLVPNDRDLLNHRDYAYEIERNADILYSDAKNSLDFLVAQRAEQHAESSHHMAVAANRLNSLAALFLPLATLASLIDVDPGNLEAHIKQPMTIGVTTLAGLVLGWILLIAVSVGAREKRRKQ